MTGHAYAIAGGKGGVGKTTTVVNLGVMLRVAGFRVAVVDGDLGMANLGTVLGVEHEPTIHDVLAGTADLEDAIVEDPDGFAVVPGSRSLAGFAEADPSKLGDVVDELRGRFDYVLVDTGGGLSHEGVLPLGLADEVILVTGPDDASIGDARKTAELVELADGSVRGVVLTRVGEDDDVDALAEALGVPLLVAIPDDPVVSKSIAASEPLVLHAPDGKAAACYRELASRLTGEEVPALDTLDRSRASPGDEAGNPDGGAEAVASESPAGTAAGEGAGTGDAAAGDQRAVVVGDGTADGGSEGGEGAADDGVETGEPGGTGETSAGEPEKRGFFSRLFRLG